MFERNKWLKRDRNTLREQERQIFGLLISQIIGSRNLKQREVASMTEIDQSGISALIHGTKPVSAEFALNLFVTLAEDKQDWELFDSAVEQMPALKKEWDFWSELEKLERDLQPQGLWE